jgi:ABC-type dipeptide/oligopeptide/nickel transport system ATPase subunit
VSPPAPSRPVGSEAAPRLLELGRLRVELKIGGQWRAVVQDVSLTLAAGQAAGIVGESGSGKSVTARSIARLLPPGARVAGDVRFDGEPVWAMSRARLRQFRARDIGIIYQDPRAHINTVHAIGDFLTEGVRDHDPRERRELAVSALRAVGIPDPERRLKQYPHQLSGGLLQRVMIAAAIMPGPRLLLADEPTTALDVTTQSEVMAVLDELTRTPPARDGASTLSMCSGFRCSTRSDGSTTSLRSPCATTLHSPPAPAGHTCSTWSLTPPITRTTSSPTPRLAPPATTTKTRRPCST